MATRRGTLFRARTVPQEVTTSSARLEEKENVNPMVGDELEIAVQERLILVRCQPRRHPRIPLRDISHLFPGNIAFLDDKIDSSPPVQQSMGNGPLRRPLPSSRKRRLAETTSHTPPARRVLRKFR